MSQHLCVFFPEDAVFRLCAEWTCLTLSLPIMFPGTMAAWDVCFCIHAVYIQSDGLTARTLWGNTDQGGVDEVMRLEPSRSPRRPLVFQEASSQTAPAPPQVYLSCCLLLHRVYD